MKILLAAVNAKYIHSNLAVYSLRAYARKYARLPEGKHTVAIAEYTINHRTDDILAGIYREAPDVLMFSCYIWNISQIEEVMEEFHKLCPGIPIWVGGPEVSYETEKFLREHPEVTGVMIGEGEETFCRLYEHYAAGRTGDALGAIKGIAYQSGGSIAVNECREPLELDCIPFCYEDIEDFENRIVYYESSRGCPFSCSYCLSSVERQLRFRDLKLVKQELSFFLEHRVPQVKFVDRTFNCSHVHAMEIWRFLRENDNGLTNFHFEISADLLTEEELKLLASLRPGLVQLEIGVQSTNEATIREIHRTMKLERLKWAVMEIQKQENIHEHLDLIAGLPCEDYETFARSFDEIYALRPNQLQLGFLKVLKGSYLSEHAAEYGIVCHSRPPYEVLRTDWLDYAQLLRIRRVEELLEVYYNSAQFEVTMKILGVLFDSAFAMFERLGVFYEENGYFGMSHSRLKRSQILLSFIESVPGLPAEAVSVIQESLIFDLYYRENYKSRPGWAPDASEWKQVSRFYCKNGKQSHVERFFYRFPEKRERVLRHLPERRGEPLYVLFDYTDRDPLDHQANVRWVLAPGEE